MNLLKRSFSLYLRHFFPVTLLAAGLIFLPAIVRLVSAQAPSSVTIPTLEWQGEPLSVGFYPLAEIFGILGEMTAAFLVYFSARSSLVSSPRETRPFWQIILAFIYTRTLFFLIATGTTLLPFLPVLIKALDYFEFIEKDPPLEQIWPAYLQLMIIALAAAGIALIGIYLTLRFILADLISVAGQEPVMGFRALRRSWRATSQQTGSIGLWGSALILAILFVVVSWIVACALFLVFTSGQVQLASLMDHTPAWLELSSAALYAFLFPLWYFFLIAVLCFGKNALPESSHPR